MIAYIKKRTVDEEKGTCIYSIEVSESIESLNITIDGTNLVFDKIDNIVIIEIPISVLENSGVKVYADTIPLFTLKGCLGYNFIGADFKQVNIDRGNKDFTISFLQTRVESVESESLGKAKKVSVEKVGGGGDSEESYNQGFSEGFLIGKII